MDILSRLYDILVDCGNDIDLAIENIEKEFICKPGPSEIYPYGKTDIILNTEEAKSVYENGEDAFELWDTLEFNIDYLKNRILSPVAPGTLFVSEFEVESDTHYEYLIPVNYPLIDYRCIDELKGFKKEKFADFILSGNITRPDCICLNTYHGISPSYKDNYSFHNIDFTESNDMLLYPNEFLGYVSRMCYDNIHFQDIIDFSIMVTEKVEKLDFHEVNPIVTEIYESKKYIDKTNK